MLTPFRRRPIEKDVLRLVLYVGTLTRQCRSFDPALFAT
jgi:hypothetical protein